MIFIYKSWEEFCTKLEQHDIYSIPAKNVDKTKSEGPYLVFKHDIETNVLKALKMAEIEHKHGHHGSYYVQAYLLNDIENIKILYKMQQMGHEISYHYDVMDSCKGDIDKAMSEFKYNLTLFEKNGFHIKTVCQHGNPIVNRIGYHSNRDFFRNNKVQKMYSDITDIMVDFKQKYDTEYNYYSDAGRQLKLIYDPIYNDIVDSEEKNIEFKNLNNLFEHICNETENAIVSIHPHRWMNSRWEYIVRTVFFNIIKKIAKAFLKVPAFKKIMSKHYYLAKKF